MDEFTDTYIVVTCHGIAGNSQWGRDRIAFYDVEATGYPWLAYDGLEDAWPINTYRTKFLARQPVPTDVTIELTGVEVGPRDWDFTAEVCVEPGGVSKTMRIYMVEVLDHYPVTASYYRNGFRQAAPTEDVAIDAGSCETVTRQLVFDEDVSWPNKEDISIVAWAQEPFDQAWAEVHQAAQLPWPFITDGAFFADGFESGDTTMWGNSTP